MIEATMPTIIAIPVVSEPTFRRAPFPGITAAASGVVADLGAADDARGSGLPVRSSESAGRTDTMSAQSADNDEG